MWVIILLDARTIDVNEEQKTQEFAKNGCTCWLGEKQQPCCTTITSDEYKTEKTEVILEGMSGHIILQYKHYINYICNWTLGFKKG